MIGPGRLGCTAGCRDYGLCDAVEACEAMPDESPKRFHAVARTNLFAFGDAAGVVGDRNLMNAITETTDLRGEFGTEFKPPGVEPHLPDEGSAERLIGRGFVSDVSPEKQIGGRAATLRPRLVR